MTKSMIAQAYAGMGPLPGAEERVWRRLDEKLNGRAKKVSVSFGRRRPMLPGLIAAAVLVLVLLAALAVRGMAARPGAETELLPAATPVPEQEVETAFRPQRRELQLINATVDGRSTLRLEEEGEFLAQAVLPDGMTVDHWLINGEQADAGKRSYSMEFDSEGVNQVEAVLREVKAVRCGENAYLQFLDENGAAAGTMYSTVCFEYDYVVPTTGEARPGGVISAYISPILPYGQELDYWVIDGERLEAEQNPRGILVQDLDRSIEIDAVLKDSRKRAESGEELLLRGETAVGLATAERPADDLPAELSELPENPAWEELDLPRDGLPYDMDAPDRDGHLHVWEIVSNTPGTCVELGVMVYHCSVCEKEYTMRYYGEHQKVWRNAWTDQFNGGGWHELVCANCGTHYDNAAHNWVRISETSYEYVCADCGAYWNPNW